MTFAAGLWLALIRAAIIAAITVAAARVVTRWLQAAPRSTRRIAAMFLIAIVFTPMLVLGYVYSSGELTLVQYPKLNELLYALLLCAKFLPIAVGVLYFGPPSAVGVAAIHCARLAPVDSALSRKRLRTWWALTMQAHGRATLLAGIAVFLLSFQEFELASLLNGNSGRQASAYSWTISLREARELQVPLAGIFGKTMIAVAIQIVVIAVGLRVLFRSEQLAADAQTAVEPGKVTRIAALVIMVFAAVLALAVPWFVVVKSGMGGIANLLNSFTFGDELLHSVMFAAASTALVFLLFAWLGRMRSRPAVFITLCLPGLMGGLVLALMLISTFQPLSGVLCAFQMIVDSPLLLLLGLVLWLFPIVMLLRWLFGVTVPRSSVHTAHLTAVTGKFDSTPEQCKRIDQLQWHLQYRWRFWLVTLVFLMAYFELMLSVLLAPTSMPSAMTRMYNLFHYGQNASSSAMILVMVTLPVVLVMAFFLLRPVLVSRLPATRQEDRT